MSFGAQYSPDNSNLRAKMEIVLPFCGEDIQQRLNTLSIVIGINISAKDRH